MDIYLVFGFISEDGSDEGHTYIYGVFDNRVVAEEKKNKLEEALERDGSDERIYIKYLKIFQNSFLNVELFMRNFAAFNGSGCFLRASAAKSAMYSIFMSEINLSYETV